MTEHLIADRYQKVHELSHGGMGVIWRAYDTVLERVVALKFIRAEYATSSAAALRFEREAKAAALLGTITDFVVKVLDYGVDRASPYIVMELLEGEDLAARLKKMGRLPVEELTPFLKQVMHALTRAHGRGLVHRDLKPENLFVDARYEVERIKILDFGLVKDLASRKITDSTQLVGTLPYMSPEQVQLLPLDHRTDLWSLGVILHQAVTGKLPFPGQNLIELVAQICINPIPPPSTVCAGLSDDVDRFFAGALARRPEERFQSAKELFEAFVRIAWAPAVDSTVRAEDAKKPPRDARSGASSASSRLDGGSSPADTCSARSTAVTDGSRRTPRFVSAPNPREIDA